MAICRTSKLRSLASRLAVSAILTTLGLVPIASAQIYIVSQKPGADRSALMTSFDNVTPTPILPGTLAWGLIFGFAYAQLPQPPATTKSNANYGALAPIPCTTASTDCLFSLGNAKDPSGKFVYLSGGIGHPDRLCGFTIDPATQAWTPVTPAGAKPAAVGSNARAVTIEPSGRFVYVAGDFNGTVSGFAIDPVTGVPTPLPGSPFATGGELPFPVVIDRSGRFVYVGQSVGSFDGSIAVFASDAATCALSHIPGSPFPNPANFGRIAALALSPDGRFLFTGGSALATYAVKPVTGARHVSPRAAATTTA